MPEWLFRVAAKKGIQKAIQTFLAAYGSHLAGAGITVDQSALIAALVGLLEVARNWLKVKQGVKWL